MIVADSAEPKSIEDLRRAGYRIEGAKKGPDSIRNSIDTLQQQKMFITERSTNAIKEAYNYRWATDNNGKNINVPEDKHNHFWDSVRYVALNRLKKSVFRYS
jgi:phage terminase large subunit